MKLRLLLLAVCTAALLRAADDPLTVIECDGLAETVTEGTETIATLHDKVIVTGNGIKIFCDYLKVVAIRKGDPTAVIGKYESFKSLLATGHVRIEQGDRVATCGHAEIFPGEDKIVLTENPVVSIERENYIASGPRMELYRGRKRAVIVGETTQRVRIILPTLKDLGPGKDKPADAAPAPATAPAPEAPKDK